MTFIEKKSLSHEKNISHFRLNIRTEAGSVLLAENFGKNDNKEK
jgi:hypothetical protein